MKVTVPSEFTEYVPSPAITNVVLVHCAGAVVVAHKRTVETSKGERDPAMSLAKTFSVWFVSYAPDEVLLDATGVVLDTVGV